MSMDIYKIILRVSSNKQGVLRHFVTKLYGPVTGVPQYIGWADIILIDFSYISIYNYNC
jgi:hypothetical protein